MKEPGTVVVTLRRGPLRRWIRLLVVLLAAAIGLILLMPTILSADVFRNGLVEEANRWIQGRVVLEDLELGWTSEQRIDGLELWPGDPGVGTALLKLPRARFELGWLSLLSGSLSLRADVTGFDAGLVIHRDGSTSLDDFLGWRGGPSRPGGTGPSGTPERPPRDLPAAFDPPRLALDLMLTGGRASVMDEGTGETTSVEDVTITLKSPRYHDPLRLRVQAEVLRPPHRLPFELTASALGADDSGFTLDLRTRLPGSGAASRPVLAAVFPLLAGADAEVRAEVELDVRLAGASLARLLAGDLAGLRGQVDVTIGDGQVRGGLYGDLEQALADLGGAGRAGGGRTELLAFHGFSGSLLIENGRATIQDAALRRADGTTRPLPVEGWIDLDGSLHYRVPWKALVSARSAALVGDRALLIQGTHADPDVDWGLEGVLKDAARRKLKDELDQRLQQGLRKLLGGKGG